MSALHDDSMLFVHFPVSPQHMPCSASSDADLCRNIRAFSRKASKEQMLLCSTGAHHSDSRERDQFLYGNK